MPVRYVHELLLRVGDPIVRGNLAARVAEAALAGMGDVVPRTAFFACIQAVAEHVFIPAVHHFPDVFFYSIADRVYA